jgi:hypothetical protein
VGDVGEPADESLHPKGCPMSTSLPAVIAEHIDAVNAFDEDRIGR